MPAPPNRRPLPIDTKVSDLSDRERLEMRCPQCTRRIGQQGYSLHLELPPDMLLIRYVSRHYCTHCSTGEHKVRAQGWISD